MKKSQTTFISLICLITISLKVFAQEQLPQDRIQSIEKGISLIGLNKSVIQTYITNKGYRFNNKTRNGDMIDYSKVIGYRKCSFSFAITNTIVNAISWTEDSIFGQDVLSEIRDNGFQIKLNVINRIGIGDIKTYSCYNYGRNVLVDLIFRQEDNYFTINLSKIYPNKPIIKVDVSDTKSNIADMTYPNDISKNLNHSKYDSEVGPDNPDFNYKSGDPLAIYFFDPKAQANDKKLDDNDQPLIGEVLILDVKKGVFYKIFKLSLKTIDEDKDHGLYIYVYNVTKSETNNDENYNLFTVVKKTKPNTTTIPGKAFYCEFAIGNNDDSYKITLFGNVVK